ncbi:MAG: diacylglycerol kinase [Candidatus Sulfobium sp.]|jgi:diacylglycerol kinase (ATP)
MPLRQWLKSANFAIEGILHGAKTQKHLRYHFFSAALVLVGGYIVGVSQSEFLLLALAVIVVLSTEMLNSAVEAVVDLLSPEFSEKARIAKDLAAGAVLIAAFGAAAIGIIILFPHLEAFFNGGFPVAKHAKWQISVIAFILVVIAVVIAKSRFGKGHPLSGGFPSGHAALAFSIWMSVTFVTENFLASLFCFVLAVAIAQSRVAVKVHSPWEVIAGALLGSTVTFLLFTVFS